ncbi:hypothetical protein [Streptomyces sp. NPDC021212]|uniref:hypothetical protein n=1 Tax=Streptomyces sp. NPDC021212 TaxID=3365118 RepID=UPI0037A7F696
MRRAGRPEEFEVAVRRADVIRSTEPDPVAAARQRERIRSTVLTAGRDPDDVVVLADVTAVLEATGEGAARTMAHLDSLTATPFTEASLRFTGTPEDLAGVLQSWCEAGAADGFYCLGCEMYLLIRRGRSA